MFFSILFILAGCIEAQNFRYVPDDWYILTRPGSINAITEDLLDCNFNRYSLQLSFYRYLLEEKYGIDISDQYIVHIKYDDCHGYVAPYLQSHVTAILKHTH